MRIFWIASLLLALFSSSAQALPSIDVVWRTNQAASLSASVSSTVTADIVLRGSSSSVVTGVFLTIGFDREELHAIGAKEFLTVNLPSMGNLFSPVVPGVVIDNLTGRVTNFEQATLSTGLATSDSRTLGSVRFHVENPTGGSGDEDVRASLENAGIDALIIGSETLEAGPGVQAAVNFGAASIDPIGLLPEPSTPLLVVGGLSMLGWAGRRRS
jgi:hypothetical protein